MDGPRGYNGQWNKSVRLRQIPYDFTYMWNLKNKMSKQNWNRLRDISTGCCQRGEALGDWVKGVKEVHNICPESSQPYTWKIETFIEQDRRKIVHRTMMPQSPSKQPPWDLTQFSQSPSATPSYFPESHQWSEISSLLKVILLLGKARSHRTPNLDCSGAESPGWFDVLPKISAWDVMHEWAHCCDKAANHQLPIAAVFWIIQIVSIQECSSFTQNLM